jgi:tetratricopeptide (TPR) repeat protein
MIWLNILWYKAYSLYALKRYEESIEPFDFVIQNHPELNSAVLDIYTWILWDLGLREKVYSVLDTAIKKNERTGPINNVLPVHLLSLQGWEV